MDVLPAQQRHNSYYFNKINTFHDILIKISQMTNTNTHSGHDGLWQFCDLLMKSWKVGQICATQELQNLNNSRIRALSLCFQNNVSPAASSSSSLSTLLSSTSSSSPSFTFFVPSLTGTTVKFVGIFTPCASFQCLLFDTLPFFFFGSCYSSVSYSRYSSPLVVSSLPSSVGSDLLLKGS